jgi:hypothetical protein
MWRVDPQALSQFCVCVDVSTDIIWTVGTMTLRTAVSCKFYVMVP